MQPFLRSAAGEVLLQSYVEREGVMTQMKKARPPEG